MSSVGIRKMDCGTAREGTNRQGQEEGIRRKWRTSDGTQKEASMIAEVMAPRGGLSDS